MASHCNSSTDLSRIFDRGYDTNASKCSHLTAILMIRIMLGEKIEGKIYVNQLGKICIRFPADSLNMHSFLCHAIFRRNSVTHRLALK